jgi:hypothetical protein
VVEKNSTDIVRYGRDFKPSTLAERNQFHWAAYWTEQVDMLESELRPLIPLNFSRKRLNPETGKAIGGTDYKFVPNELFEKCIAYLRNCIAKDQIPAIRRICLYAKISRKEAWEISAGARKNDKNFEFLKWVFGFIEEMVESSVHKAGNPAGAIFVLKNFGWADKLEIAPSTPGIMTEEDRIAIRARMRKFAE